MYVCIYFLTLLKHNCHVLFVLIDVQYFGFVSPALRTKHIWSVCVVDDALHGFSEWKSEPAVTQANVES